MPDDELMRDWRGSPGAGDWVHYTDCLREVVFGIYQGLLDIAIEIESNRTTKGLDYTGVQRILKEWHIAYRQFRGVVFGLRGPELDAQHFRQNLSLGKQRTIRNNIVHCVMAEFWAHGTAVRNALQTIDGNKTNGSTIQATCDVFGMPPVNFGTLQDLLEISERRHGELIQEFSKIPDEALDVGRSWWENSDVTIRFRLNRMGWHLKDHTAVIQTICERIGRKRSETERLAQALYEALGKVEAAAIGLSAPEADQRFIALTAILRERCEDLVTAYSAR